MRWICGLQDNRQHHEGRGDHARLLLGPSATPILRHRPGRPAPIASEALERIAALYAIEKTIRGRSAGERRTVRQGKSKPLVLALKAWLEQQLTRVSGKATIAEDIRYALNHWEGLARFLDDGRIELRSSKPALAGFAHRRAHAVGLAPRALRKPQSSVTPAPGKPSRQRGQRR